jgi:hypothetical protein
MHILTSMIKSSKISLRNPISRTALTGFLFFRCPVFIILFSLFFTGCKKDNNIGLDVQPESDRLDVIYQDTVTLRVFTMPEDSVSTDERTYNLLGSYADPVFGLSRAEIMTQVRISSNNVTFGTNAAADSVVLYLDYQDYYGEPSDTLDPQQIFVYELTKDIYKDSSYYSNLDPAAFFTAGTETAVTYTPRPGDSVLAIKLSDDYAQRIIAAGGTDVLLDNDHFLNVFKGLYLATNQLSAGGSIVSFNLLSASTKMVLYYHNDSDPDITYNLLINSNCARINLFKHDYTGTAISNLLLGGLQDTLAYIQGGCGLRAKIVFPYISSFSSSSSCAIIKAELVVNLASSDLITYPPPEGLSVRAISADGSLEVIPDDPLYMGVAYYGGSYDDASGQYKINITRYVQQLVSGQHGNTGLYLFPASTRISMDRAVITSGMNSNRMKLLITFARL